MGDYSEKIIDGMKVAYSFAQSGISNETPTAEIRWVRPPHTTTERDVLMQKWAITRYSDTGATIGVEYEWRTVPVFVA